MPQKKTASRSKGMKRKKALNSKAKSSHSNLMTSAERMEKEFRAMPAKIALCYRSELMTVKHQETKLKGDLKKAHSMQMDSDKKLSLLAKSKTKSKPAMKKLMASAKKMKDHANKSAKDLAAKLSQLHKTMLALDGKQAKFTALGKMLGQLESQLGKRTMKAAKSSKKSGKKTMKRSKTSAHSTGTSQQMPPMMSSSQSDDSNEMN